MSNIERFKKSLITREFLLFFAAFVIALLLRFVLLGHPSLGNLEAEQALQALQSASGKTVAIGGQPGYVALTALVFFIFGGSDFAARFWPALFGAFFVFIPLLFQKYLGKTPAMITAFLFALDPGLITLSRSADGTMIAIAAVLAAFGFYLDKKVVPGGIFFGMAIISSPHFWPFTAALGLALFLNYRKFPENGEETSAEGTLESKPKWGLWLLPVLVTSTFIASQFFVHPNGISGIATGLMDYFRSWAQGDGLILKDFFLILLFTGFPVLLLGIWGLVRGLISKSPLYQFLGLWWGFEVLLSILNPALSNTMIVFMNIPLLVLTALQLSHLILKIQFPSRTVGLVQVVATISLIIFSLFNFLKLINFPNTDPVLYRNQIIGTLLPIPLLIIMTLLLAWGWNSESAKQGVLVGLGILLATLLIGSTWKSAGFGSRPENEINRSESFVNGDKALLQSLSDLSRWNTGQASQIDIVVVGIDSPSLLWALRHYEKTIIDTVVSKNSNPSILITGMDTEFEAQTLYRGQGVVWATGPDLNQMKFADWVKWSFMRTAPQEQVRIILWARNDLFKDSAAQ